MMQVPLNKISQVVDIDEAKFPAVTNAFIFAYGIRQLLNDAMASAKLSTPPTKDELANARAMAEKRLTNLLAGTFRASAVLRGNPVRARAIELALGAVKASPGFTKWLTANKLKPSNKAAIAAAREEAVKHADKEGSPFMAQAEKDIGAAKALGSIDVDFG